MGDQAKGRPGGNPRSAAVGAGFKVTDPKNVILESLVHKEGDWVTAPGTGQELRVRKPCADKHGGYWYCSTHQEGFENQFQKDIHINAPGKVHRLLWLCKSHGPEQP